MANQVKPEGEVEGKGAAGTDQGHGHEVAVTIDGNRKEIQAGNYEVSVLKTKLGVPADYELDQVIHGEFKELADSAHVEIKGGETFVSHVRRGGSS
jgi:hypothetical protein